MSADRADRGSAEWENATLARFLEALSACLQDGKQDARWAAFARALVTSSRYE